MAEKGTWILLVSGIVCLVAVLVQLIWVAMEEGPREASPLVGDVSTTAPGEGLGAGAGEHLKATGNGVPEEGNRTLSDTAAVPDSEASIAGEVMSADGNPIEGATVDAWAHENFGDHRVVTTDGRGQYRLDDLWDSSYSFRVRHPLYVSEHRFDVPPAVQTLNIVMLRRPAVAIQVVDAQTNEPIPDFSYRREEDASPVTVHDPEGRARMERARDFVLLTVWAIGYSSEQVKVGPLEPEHVHERRVLLKRVAIVEGTVLMADGRAAVGADVSLTSPRINRRPPQILARSDAEGRFRIASLTHEQHRLLATHDEGGAGVADVDMNVAAERIPVTIILQRGGAVAGRVFLGGGPLEGASVWVSRPIEAAWWPGEFSIRTGEDGAYRLSGLYPGETTVHALVRNPEGSRDPPFSRQLSSETDIARAQETVVDFHFAAADSGLEGRLLLAGEPFMGFASVRLEVIASGDREFFVSPTRDGAFYRFEPLPAGPARITVCSDSERGLIVKALQVALVEGETITQDIELMGGGGRLSGRVLGCREGEWVSVSLSRSSFGEGDLFGPDRWSDQWGRQFVALSEPGDQPFAWIGLTPGVYTLEVSTSPMHPSDASSLAFVPRTANATLDLPSGQHLTQDLVLSDLP